MKKRFRLTKNHDIKTVVDLRQSLGNKYYIVYRKLTTDETLKVAISVSKKYGTAVERNYAKRCVREIIRPEIENLSNVNLVVVVKNLSKDLCFEEKKELLLKLLKNAKSPVLTKPIYKKIQEEK
jgi:ribonuclease P protein component